MPTQSGVYQPPSPAGFVAIVVVNALLCLVMWLGVAIFYVRRDRFPLSIRPFPFVVVFAVVTTIFGHVMTPLKHLELSCLFHVFIHMGAVNIGILVFNIRTYRLVLCFKLQDMHLLRLTSSLRCAELRQRLRRVDSGWTLLLGSCVVVVLHVVMLLYGALVDGRILVSSTDCFSVDDHIQYSLACFLMCVGFVIWAYGGFQLTGALADGYKLKREVLGFGAVLAVLVPPWFISFFVSFTGPIWGNDLFLPLICISVQGWLIWYPIALSFEQGGHKVVTGFINRLAEEETCKQYLQARVGAELQAWYAFLQSEFAVENMVFWAAVNRLESRLLLPAGADRAFASEEDARGECLKIVELFIRPGGPCAVNISSARRRLVLAAVPGPHPPRATTAAAAAAAAAVHREASARELLALLAPCRDEVMGVMEADSWVRFRRSRFYLGVLELRHQKMRAGRLYSAGSICGNRPTIALVGSEAHAGPPKQPTAL